MTLTSIPMFSPEFNLERKLCNTSVLSSQANMSMMEYARSFELTMKESITRVTQWAAFYHTSRK